MRGERPLALLLLCEERSLAFISALLEKGFKATLVVGNSGGERPGNATYPIG